VLASGAIAWFVGLAFSLSCPAHARAETANALADLTLEWPRVNGCPDEGYVREMILRALGGALPRARDIRASVTIVHDSSWHLRLAVESPEGHGERLLEGDSCAQAADAMAVILAMLIDPEAARAAAYDGASDGEPPRGTLVPRVNEPPLASVQLVAGSVAIRRSEASDGRGLDVGLGVAASLGLENKPRAGVAITLDRAFGAWRGFVNAMYWPVHSTALPSDPQRGAHVSVGALGIAFGPRVRVPRFELVPRVGAAGYWARARGYGVDQPLSDSIWWSSFGLGQASLLELRERIWLLATLDFHFPIARPAARLEPGGDVLRPGVIGAQAYLGVFCRY
jgi:hypothetical protein